MHEAAIFCNAMVAVEKLVFRSIDLALYCCDEVNSACTHANSLFNNNSGLEYSYCLILNATFKC